MRTAQVIVASTRASAGVYEDRSGPVIVDWLTARGFEVAPPVVVADGGRGQSSLFAAVEARVDVVLTSGGHRHLADRPHRRCHGEHRRLPDPPGLADAIRRSGLPHVPTSVLSRGGVCGVRDGS